MPSYLYLMHSYLYFYYFTSFILFVFLFYFSLFYLIYFTFEEEIELEGKQKIRILRERIKLSVIKEGFLRPTRAGPPPSPWFFFLFWIFFIFFLCFSLCSWPPSLLPVHTTTSLLSPFHGRRSHHRPP